MKCWTGRAPHPRVKRIALVTLALGGAAACGRAGSEARSERTGEGHVGTSTNAEHLGDSDATDDSDTTDDSHSTGTTTLDGGTADEGAATGEGAGLEEPAPAAPSDACTFTAVATDAQVDEGASLGAAPVSERFGLCSSGGWCWANPLPHGHDLRASWAIASDDFWAVSGAGGLLRWHGGEWSTVSTGVSARFYDVWGSSEDDVWAVGALVGASSRGIVAHFDGATWSIAGDGFSSPLLSIWGGGPDDVWAVGAEGFTAHWDGAAWSEPGSGVQTQNLNAVWGSGPNDVWAVGRGTLIHWNGSAWSTRHDLSDNFNLEAVWGSGASDVWAVGHGYQFSGTLHYDGSTWTEVNTIANGLSYDVWGSGPNDVWAVGFISGAAGSAVTHWDGSSWSLDAVGSGLGTTITNDIFRSVTGTGVGDVWAVGNGGTIIRHDGGSWTRVGPATLVNRTSFGAVWSNSANDAWAVGSLGLAGRAGSILHWNGESWTPRQEGLPETTALHDVWSSGPDDVWVVGEGEGDTILRYDGTSWSVAYEAESAGLTGIWGTAEGEVWVYGGIYGAHGSGAGASTLVHWDGSVWTSTTLETRLSDMWGSGADDVWAVGDNTILHWNGSSWQPVTTCAPNVQRVWGTGSDDVWVAGAEMLHWDGSRWSSADLGVGGAALWGSGPDDVWAAGPGSEIHHFDGETWSSSPSGTSFRIRDVSGSGANDVWVVGEEGLILHR